MASSVIKYKGLDLLWTNSNTSVNFNSQTINVDYSKYRLLIIDWRNLNDGSRSTTQVVPIANTEFTKTIFYNIAGRFGYRNITLNANKNSIYFGDSRYYETYGQTDTVRNDMAIPIKIYGIN